MPLGHWRALNVLRRTFRHHPRSARLHIFIRYMTAPFLRTLDFVPPGARLLDIGAGHGTYARLALENGARQVIAVEPDLRKALLPLRVPGLGVVAAFDQAIRGSFDAVVIYDATYRMSLAERDALYTRVFDRLNPGGVFILKDLDPGHRLKMGWARFQELLSDTFLGISIGRGFLYESRSQIEERLSRIGFVDFAVREVGAWYPHPHIVYTARRPLQEMRAVA
jgi:cyclopropane fatty-acyl-phospholipid synthase-like methyltransferase